MSPRRLARRSACAWMRFAERGSLTFCSPAIAKAEVKARREAAAAPSHAWLVAARSHLIRTPAAPAFAPRVRCLKPSGRVAL